MDFFAKDGGLANSCCDIKIQIIYFILLSYFFFIMGTFHLMENSDLNFR